MLAVLIHLKNGLVRLLEWTLIFLVGGLVLDVIWQVASRYILKNPSSWTDELATLLIIWVALLGASVAFIRQGHLGIDYLVSKWSPTKRLWNEIFVHGCVMFFAGAILLFGGAKLVILTLATNQVSPALNVKMGHVYLALPVSGLFIFLFSVEAIFERIARLKSKEDAR